MEHMLLRLEERITAECRIEPEFAIGDDWEFGTEAQLLR
jgi:hypothetical protein